MTKGSAQPRGNTADRARRRAWLVETYRADVDLLLFREPAVVMPPPVYPYVLPRTGSGIEYVMIPACRCWRCGDLLHDNVRDAEGNVVIEGTLTVDRIKPGGTYRRDNIRPACKPCQDRQGYELGWGSR